MGAIRLAGWEVPPWMMDCQLIEHLLLRLRMQRNQHYTLRLTGACTPPRPSHLHRRLADIMDTSPSAWNPRLARPGPLARHAWLEH
eukprot:2983585-Karenia_brevis.AAC.1